MNITLATLPYFSAQQVFDFVAKHLLTQMERSMSDDQMCRYRHGQLKCAAGCLIADEEYKESFEGRAWIYLKTINQVTACHFDLINSLQRVHDGSQPHQWKQRLETLAGKLGLTMPTI